MRVQNEHGNANPRLNNHFGSSTFASYIFTLEKACGPGLDVLM